MTNYCLYFGTEANSWIDPLTALKRAIVSFIEGQGSASITEDIFRRIMRDADSEDSRNIHEQLRVFAHEGRFGYKIEENKHLIRFFDLQSG